MENSVFGEAISVTNKKYSLFEFYNVNFIRKKRISLDVLEE